MNMNGTSYDRPRAVPSRADAQGLFGPVAAQVRQALRGPIPSGAFEVDGSEVAILDLKLPGLDGLAVCRRAPGPGRVARLELLILCDTRGGSGDALDLDLRAAGFASSRCDPRAFEGRLKSMLKRAGLSDERPTVDAGAIRMDRDRHQVLVNGLLVKLTPNEFEILRALMEARGRTLTREELLERIWEMWDEQGPRHAGNRRVDVYIYRLRQKLGSEKRRLLTVRKAGYRLDVSTEGNEAA